MYEIIKKNADVFVTMSADLLPSTKSSVAENDQICDDTKIHQSIADSE